MAGVLSTLAIVQIGEPEFLRVTRKLEGAAASTEFVTMRVRGAGGSGPCEMDWRFGFENYTQP